MLYDIYIYSEMYNNIAYFILSKTNYKIKKPVYNTYVYNYTYVLPDTLIYWKSTTRYL